MDIRADQRFYRKLQIDRIIGAMYEQVLYADDTIIFSEDTATLGQFVQQIGDEGAKYGRTLNRSKNELLNLNQTRMLRFSDGTLVPLVNEAKYLGCMLNDKGDPKREVNKRISGTYLVWKRLELFWKHSNCSVRQKLVVYDAVVRSKLIYGLQSVQVNDELKRKMDAFQLKGWRQTLKLHTTFGQQSRGEARTNTNYYVYYSANMEINTSQPAYNQQTTIINMSEFFVAQRRKLITRIITSSNDDPIREIALEVNALTQIDSGRRPSGKRNNWWP